MSSKVLSYRHSCAFLIHSMREPKKAAMMAALGITLLVIGILALLTYHGVHLGSILNKLVSLGPQGACCFIAVGGLLNVVALAILRRRDKLSSRRSESKPQVIDAESSKDELLKIQAFYAKYSSVIQEIEQGFQTKTSKYVFMYYGKPLNNSSYYTCFTDPAAQPGQEAVSIVIQFDKTNLLFSKKAFVITIPAQEDQPSNDPGTRALMEHMEALGNQGFTIAAINALLSDSTQRTLGMISQPSPSEVDQ